MIRSKVVMIRSLLGKVLSFLLCCSIISDCYAFSSQAIYESYVTTHAFGATNGSSLDSCSSLSKIPLYSELNNLYNISMSYTIADNATLSPAAYSAISGIITSVYALLFANLALMDTMPFPFSVIALGTEILMLLEVCTNYFIIQPHEEANMSAGFVGTGCALNEYDLPYYFQCSDTTAYGYNRGMCLRYIGAYNAMSSTSTPSLDSRCTPNNCLNPISSSAITNTIILQKQSKLPNHCFSHDYQLSGSPVGSVTLGYDGSLGYRITEARHAYAPKEIHYFVPGDVSRGSYGVGDAFLYSYYRFNATYPSRLEACVMSLYTMLPVVIGCAPVAPPTEIAVIDENLTTYLSGNRCQYITEARSDLNSLGDALPRYYNNGVDDGLSTKRFLQSHMHMTSTVVGCVKDLVVALFINNRTGEDQAFLAIIQERLRPLINAFLTLYVALVGIKIIAPAQQLEMKDYIMFLLKFALVLYLTNFTIWSEITELLIYGADEISSIFMDATISADAMGRCKYTHDANQVLSDRVITDLDDLVSTYGSTGVKTTVWDMIDCKVMNYINLGSCNYSFAGMLGLLLLGTAMVFNTAGPVAYVSYIFGALMFGYLYLSFSIFWKVARISILVVIVVATLLACSPLFVCFWLFDHTSEIFKKWCKYLLGYFLYPILFMGLVSMIMITLDTVYYGFTSYDLSSATSLLALCNDTPSLFCATVKYMGGDPCTVDMSVFNSLSFTIFGGMALKVFVLYVTALTKITLISMLLYFLKDSSITFIATLVGVSGMDDIAKSGLLNFMIERIQEKIQERRKGK